jgi:hypothetical protein
MGRGICAIALLTVLAWPVGARAGGEFDLGVGYGKLWIDGAEGVFDERDGVRVEPRFSFDLCPKIPQLRLGVGVSVSGYSHELAEDTIITIDDGDEIHIIEADQWESVGLIVPELQLSWRQTLGDDGHWFIEPGVGVGAVIANYWAGDEWWWDDDDETSEWDVTFGVRPFVRAGYAWENWSVGLEASYLWGGNVELTDQVDGDLREFYAGAFFGVSW